MPEGRAKILVVEDNAIIRRLVRLTLQSKSYEVIEAADAASALAIAPRERPDLVVQDLRLPDLDGFDLLRRLRALPEMVDVPVIAFSGFVSRLEEARASAIGFSDFLVKPLQPTELIRAIQAHLPNRAAVQAAGGGRRVLFVDDDPVQRKLGRVQLELQGFRVQTADDGVEALAMARAQAFDVIVSDVLMPRLDGFGLCMAIRQDPNLARLPVVLCSNTYLEAEDEALGRRLGASAFVARSAGMAAVADAALAALRQDSVPAPVGAATELHDRHVYRIISQLEHQAGINAGLARRCASQSAALAILSTISDTLAKSLDRESAIDEVLGRCLEAGGFSVGALYLLDTEGRLRVNAQSGYSRRASPEAVERLFGQEALLRSALDGAAPVVIPSPSVDEGMAREFLARTGASSALILPILFRDERLGVLLVAADLTDLSGEESLDFARTIGHQIGQVIALRRSFTRMAAAEQEYRGLFEHAVEGIFRATPDGRYLLVNPAMARIFGYATPEEMVTSLTDIRSQLYVDPEQRDTLLRLLSTQGSVSGFEGQGRRRDGTVIWVSQSVRAVHDAGGRVVSYEGLLEDITERRKAEAATAALAQTSRALLESLDIKGVTQRVTENLRRLLDARSVSVYCLEPESGDLVAVGHSATGERASVERFPAGTGLVARAVSTRRPRVTSDVLLEPDVQYTATTRAALEADVERAVLAVPLAVRDGVFGSLVIRDHTGRVFDTAEIGLAQAFADQAAIALNNARLFEDARAGRDFLASVAGNSADAIVATDADGRVTFFSTRAEEIWGRPASEVLGRPLADLLGEPDQARALLERLHAERRIQNREITVCDPAGRGVELSLSFAVLRDAAGAVNGLVAVGRDVTERKRTEAALRQSEKLAAMSSLVAGLAHELNNPLSVILAHSTLLAAGGAANAEARATKIIKAAERCARLVRNFLALARQHPPERQRVVLDQVVQETAELLAYTLRVDGVTVTLDLAGDVPALWADPHQLQQVLLNLLTNAHHAVRTIDPPRDITVSTRLAAGPRVLVCVADNGPGIPPAARERIFEPFFTTKSVGQGTGLGLSLCQGIVESHGGTLSFESPPEGGAVFTIALPVTAPPTMAPPVVTPAERVAALRVLVVDDEPEVASVLVDMLSIDGHRVEVAPNGRMALDRLRDGDYDLVMSDLRMPELDGAALYRTLQDAGHPIVHRFVFVTGDVLGPESHQFLSQAEVLAVAKPFVLSEVRNVIRQVFGTETTPSERGRRKETDA